MTNRITKKWLQKRFDLAMDVAGLPHGETYVNGKAQVGVHFIDHNSFYGGYTIRKIANEHGGESEVFGGMRYTAAEFNAHLTGIVYAARMIADKAK
jgi:hypothetical protein